MTDLNKDILTATVFRAIAEEIPNLLSVSLLAVVNKVVEELSKPYPAMLIRRTQIVQPPPEPFIPPFDIPVVPTETIPFPTINEDVPNVRIFCNDSTPR